nr:AT-rich interactive domain-containing protein 2-like [Ipomoea batatas]
METMCIGTNSNSRVSRVLEVARIINLVVSTLKLHGFEMNGLKIVEFGEELIAELGCWINGWIESEEWEQGIVKGCSTVEPEKCLFLESILDAEMLVQLRRIALDPYNGCSSLGLASRLKFLRWTVPLGNVRADSADGDSDDSRWLGTRVWPIEIDDTKLSTRSIGKRQSRVLQLVKAPGSVDCVRRHVLEERLLLQCDLGPGFLNLGNFDQMGEQMMKSWTDNRNKFLLQCVLSLDVLVCKQGCHLKVQVDTDDDEAGDSNYLHVPQQMPWQNWCACEV